MLLQFVLLFNFIMFRLNHASYEIIPEAIEEQNNPIEIDYNEYRMSTGRGQFDSGKEAARRNFRRTKPSQDKNSQNQDQIG